MYNPVTMLPGDTISGKEAKAYFSHGNKRKLLFNATKLSADIEVITKEVPILGEFMVGHKAVGAKGSGTLTVYKNTALFDEIVQKMLKGKGATYFELQVINDDQTSNAGKRDVTLLKCHIGKISVAQFDANGEVLEEEIPFTFQGVLIAENFEELDGMDA